MKSNLKFKIIVLCLAGILLLSACNQDAISNKSNLGYFDDNAWGMTIEQVKDKYPESEGLGPF